MKSLSFLILILSFFAASCTTKNKQIDCTQTAPNSESMNKIQIKYSIELTKTEDYNDVGNSRIGGVPDLSKGINYPEFELPENFSSNNYDGGYYSFLLQLNLSKQNIPYLPSQGILSIFYGSIEDEVFGFYFPDKSDLELTPTTKKNYYCWTDEYPNISYKFKVVEQFSEDYKEYKDYSDEFTTEENISHWKSDFFHSNSYFFDQSIEGKWYIYCKSQNLPFLRYSSILQYNYQDKSFYYIGQNDTKYSSLDEFLSNQNLDIYQNQYNDKDKFMSELRQFDNNKSYHIERFNDFVCLISLASNDTTEMIWGDYHKFEIFGYKSDFLKGNFSKLYSI